MNRKIAFLLALLLLTSALLVLTSGAVGGMDIYEYTENSDGTLTISKYLGKSALVAIPAILDGRSVTAIGDGVFSGHSEIMRVYISEGIKTIGEEAFYGCSSLLYLELPDSLLSIGAQAFAKCSALEFAVIPEKVGYFGASAFGDCPSLSDIIFLGGPFDAVFGASPFGNARIFAPSGSSPAAFAKANSLEFAPISSPEDFSYKKSVGGYTVTSYNGDARAVIVPSHRGAAPIIAIDGAALSAASGRAKKAEIIILPDTITSIPSSLCLGNTALRQVVMPESLSGGISRDAFNGCSSLLSIRIPIGTTVIGHSAFENASSLRTLILDCSVSEISSEAFRNCVSLKTFFCPGDAPSVHGSALASIVAFYGVSDATVYTDSKSSWDTKNGKWAPDSAVSFNFKAIDASCSHTERIVTPVSCSKDGVSEFICRFCGDIYRKTYPVIDHVYISTGVSNGVEAFYCQFCTSNYTRRHISACTISPTLDLSLPAGSQVTSIDISFKGHPLTADVDFSFTESYNDAMARPELVIVGVGDYIGSVQITYVEKSRNWENYYTVSAPDCSGEGHYVNGDIILLTPLEIPEGYEPANWTITGTHFLSAGRGGASFIMVENDISVSFEFIKIPETEPPVTTPPVTEPPIETDPPVTEPPVTEPPDETDPPVPPPQQPDKDAYMTRWILLGGILLLSLGGIITLCVIMFRKE